jgi:hypothetical protein
VIKYVTYLIYILSFEAIVLGGIGYAVFVLGFSGWWFALAVALSFCAYKPSDWIGKESNDDQIRHP